STAPLTVTSPCSMAALASPPLPHKPSNLRTLKSSTGNCLIITSRMPRLYCPSTLRWRRRLHEFGIAGAHFRNTSAGRDPDDRAHFAPGERLPHVQAFLRQCSAHTRLSQQHG